MSKDLYIKAPTWKIAKEILESVPVPFGGSIIDSKYFPRPSFKDFEEVYEERWEDYKEDSYYFFDLEEDELYYGKKEHAKEGDREVSLEELKEEYNAYKSKK